MNWINRLAEAGAASLMMNLECWSEEARRRVVSGKHALCPREQYLAAFRRSVEVLGPGRTTTCFVVGTEPAASLKEGIRAVVELGVIPSPVAGRYFEDVPNYPFAPNANWEEFLGILQYAGALVRTAKLVSTDRAGCVACGMCDLIREA